MGIRTLPKTIKGGRHNHPDVFHRCQHFQNNAGFDNQALKNHPSERDRIMYILL